MKRRKKTETQKLIEKLDVVFSQYIRLKYANHDGMVECYTCGVKRFWKKDMMQNGHFVSRANKKYRYDPKNCRPQCYSCNVMKHGNYIIYTQKMQQELGPEVVAEMTSMKSHHEIIKRDIGWYKAKIEEYKRKIKKIREEKGL